MAVLNLEKTLDAWSVLKEQIFVPQTELEYQKLVGLLDELIDQVGENESHPLASLMEIIGILIERYEDLYVPEL